MTPAAVRSWNRDLRWLRESRNHAALRAYRALLERTATVGATGREALVACLAWRAVTRRLVAMTKEAER